MSKAPPPPYDCELRLCSQAHSTFPVPVAHCPKCWALMRADLLEGHVRASCVNRGQP